MSAPPTSSTSRKSASTTSKSTGYFPLPSPNKFTKSSSDSSGETAPYLHQLLLRAAGNCINHPFDYTRLLIQLGYEPWAPVPGNYLTRKVLYFPNQWKYVKYIRSVDGVVGCYRGLGPRLISNTLHCYIATVLADQFNPIIKNYYEEDEDEEDDEDGVKKKPPPPSVPLNKLSYSSLLVASTPFEYNVKKCIWDILCTCGGSIVAQPLHVVSVRMMSQFVGREKIYSSIWSSISHIYSTEGLVGFFRGLQPRLIGESLYLIIIAIVFNTLKAFDKDKHMPDYARGIISSYTANTFSYQFNLVSNYMIVNGSELAIGNPPFTPIFMNNNWLDGWRYLRDEKQLARGASQFGRIYQGKVITAAGGEMKPIIGKSMIFGPIHPAGIGKK